MFIVKSNLKEIEFEASNSKKIRYAFIYGCQVISLKVIAKMFVLLIFGDREYQFFRQKVYVCNFVSASFGPLSHHHHIMIDSLVNLIRIEETRTMDNSFCKLVGI